MKVVKYKCVLTHTLYWQDLEAEPCVPPGGDVHIFPPLFRYRISDFCLNLCILFIFYLVIKVCSYK